MEMIYDARLWALTLALFAAIWFMKRMAVREGYVRGISHGFAHGIDQVSEILVKHSIIKHDEKPLTKDELVGLLAPIATANLVEKITKDMRGK